MTEGLVSRQRRRATVSLSPPGPSGEPVEQLDRAVDLIHQVTRTLPGNALSRDELIALGGLLTQISGALLTLTDQLIPPTHHCDRTRALSGAGQRTTTHLLLDCRNSYLAARAAAQAFHAGIKR